MSTILRELKQAYLSGDRTLLVRLMGQAARAGYRADEINAALDTARRERDGPAPPPVDELDIDVETEWDEPGTTLTPMALNQSRAVKRDPDE